MTSLSFKFGEIQYVEHGTPGRRIGIHSAGVMCACGNIWIATTANGMFGVVGGMRVSCPACQRVEDVPRAKLGF